MIVSNGGRYAALTEPEELLMLFHVTHVHSSDTCPYNKPEIIKDTFGKVPGSIEDAGASLVGAYVNAAAHTIYFIIDANSAEQLQACLDPIIDMGDTDTSPVVDFEAVIRAQMANQ